MSRPSPVGELKTKLLQEQTYGVAHRELRIEGAGKSLWQEKGRYGLDDHGALLEESNRLLD